MVKGTINKNLWSPRFSFWSIYQNLWRWSLFWSPEVPGPWSISNCHCGRDTTGLSRAGTLGELFLKFFQGSPSSKFRLFHFSFPRNDMFESLVVFRPYSDIFCYRPFIPPQATCLFVCTKWVNVVVFRWCKTAQILGEKPNFVSHFGREKPKCQNTKNTWENTENAQINAICFVLGRMLVISWKILEGSATSSWQVQGVQIFQRVAFSVVPKVVLLGCFFFFFIVSYNINNNNNEIYL